MKWQPTPVLLPGTVHGVAKSQTRLSDFTFMFKVLLVKAMVFPSSHVWMWELDYKENWVLKNWCFWTVVLEKTLESPLDCKEIQPLNPKGGQSWIFIGRTDAEAETPILWSPHAKNWLIGKDWRWEEKGMTEDAMAGWYHWLDGHEFEQAPGAGDGQGGLACCGPWGCKESDVTERLNWTECSVQFFLPGDLRHDSSYYFCSRASFGYFWGQVCWW